MCSSPCREHKNRPMVHGEYLVDEEVLWFQVSVENVVHVTEGKSTQQLVHERLKRSENKQWK
ncbi:hypothetical protein DPMN_039244 [Dreissena polymorpha]|uniref:Uncharacterized protein n=1 Tax=Dreissena polymorpha TaxID=45954 RepID=A0A9D4MGZ2_DREPO|nr:hypothetical protein DPMN_039244 [Dreissena polymorpha]